LTWIGWLWLGGVLAAFFKPWRGLLWFVVLPTTLYLLSVFSVGDAVSRYLLPAEWSAYLLAAVALDALIAAATTGKSTFLRRRLAASA